MLSAKAIENPTKSNLSNKNIELAHIIGLEVGGQFQAWSESSLISSRYYSPSILSALLSSACWLLALWS